VNEHDGEPVPGLPAQLPASEHILWQGAPRWQKLAVHAFHVRKVAVYFVLLLLWRALEQQALGVATLHMLPGLAWLAFLGALVVGMLAALAWLSARSALFTITNRRVVLRHGVALSLTVNLPFSAIDGATLRKFRDGSGEVLISIHRGERFGYVLNWPYVRQWHFTRPQPALRGLTDAQQASAVLSRAWQAVESTAAARDTAAPAKEVPAWPRHGEVHESLAS
jgi:hypothetical protein